MEISIQTDRPFKRNLSKPIQYQPIKQLDPQQQIQKQRYIKKLTIKNRQLLQALKQKNSQLTEIISKKKIKPKAFIGITKTKGFQSIKKQLTNAYKQIDVYKMTIANLRAKEISSQAFEKLSIMQSRSRIQDLQIEQLHKQLRILNSMKGMQQRQIKIFESDEIKKNIQNLQNQITNQKQKIKIYRKSDSKRQQNYKKQQAYQLQLQKLTRQYNDKYYPGQQLKKKEQKKILQDVDIAKITQTQWDDLKRQVKQMRNLRTEYNLKIQNLTQLKLKQIKSAEQNQLKFKQKQKIVKNLRTKVSQLKKLLVVRKGKRRYGDSSISQLLNDDQYQFNSQMANKQFKKWSIPQANIVQNGKIYPNSIFFSDKQQLQQSKKSRIIQIKMWTNIDKQPCFIQAFYKNQNDQTIAGKLPSLELNLNSLNQNRLVMDSGDYLIKIEGETNQKTNNIGFINFISRYGKTLQCGKKNNNNTKFTLCGNNDEIPTCIYGAYLPRVKNQYRICHIGCQLAKDW